MVQSTDHSVAHYDKISGVGLSSSILWYKVLITVLLIII